MEIITIVVIFLVLFFVFNKWKKNREKAETKEIFGMVDGELGIFTKVNTGDFKEQFEQLFHTPNKFKDKSYQVSNSQLVKAIGGDFYGYVRQFSPTNNMINDITFGKIAGGGIGAAQAIQGIAGGLSSSKQFGALAAHSGGFGYGFTKDEFEDVEPAIKYPIYGLCALYANGLVDSKVFAKSIATLFRSYGSPNVKKDALGELVFKDDEEKTGAAIGYQYFMENHITDEVKVLDLLDDLKVKLPNGIREEVKEYANLS